MRYYTILVMVLLLLPGLSTTAQTPNPSGEATISAAKTPKKKKKKRKKNKKVDEEAERMGFFAAVEGGDTARVAAKLSPERFYDFNSDGETALTLAIKQGDVDMVRLLEEKAVINLKNKSGESPLTIAIKGENPEIIRIIMERAKPGLKNDEGVTPLMLALEQQNLSLMQELILRGAQVNRKSNGVSPIARAVSLNNVQAVALLVQKGADPSQANDDGDIPLYIAVRNGFNVIAGILLQKSSQPSVDANWKTKMGEPLLNLAIQQDQGQIARILLDFGADTYQTDYLENTGLNLAAEKGDTELVQMLLDRGADPNHANLLGTTPITAATQRGHDALADLLAQAGANPGVRNFDGFAATDNRTFDHLTDPEIVDAVMEVMEEY
jgi:ankyrin repeat protein